MAVALMSNVHTAKLICDISNAATQSCGINVTPNEHNDNGNNVCSIRDGFDYGMERGPHTWSFTGENQSPINIMDKYIKKFPIRELLTWNHYDDLPTSVTLENNGHTVVVRATYSGNTPTLCGADLLASYTFVELCFRWSILNDEGSEHMVNSTKYPLEMQAMHHTGSTEDSISSYDLLIVAYFYEISANNPYLNPVVQNLHRIQKAGTKIEIPPFPLAYLCHPFRKNFYSYGGSLTEPPCHEGVEWFILPEPLAISERQLNEFRQLMSFDNNSRIVSNSRPVQNMNSSRVINLNQYNPMCSNTVAEVTPSQSSLLT